MKPDADFIVALTFMRDKCNESADKYRDDDVETSAFYRGKEQAFTQVLKMWKHRDDARRGKKCTR